MERRHEIGLDSYDRLFPSQDTMPKGGFGNLIALPLQFGPREKGNSVFVNKDLMAFPDQWAFLSRISKMEALGVERIVRDASRDGAIIGVRMSLTEEDAEEDPWAMKPSRKRIDKHIEGPLPQSVRMVLSNLLYIEKKDLPAGMVNRLIRLAAFQNPEFYKAQAMRLSTFGKPRVIGCAEDFPVHIGLPRGCLSEAKELLQSYKLTQAFPGEEGKKATITAYLYEISYGAASGIAAAAEIYLGKKLSELTVSEAAFAILLQISSNIAHSAEQGVMPDLVSEEKRGRFSSVKAMLELPVPLILVFFLIKPIFDNKALPPATQIAAALGVAVGVVVLSMLVAMFFPEKLREDAPPPLDWQPFLRLLAMTAVFTAIILSAGWVSEQVEALVAAIKTIPPLMLSMGLVGLAGMVICVALGVWLSVRINPTPLS